MSTSTLFTFLDTANFELTRLFVLMALSMVVLGIFTIFMKRDV